MNKRYQYLIVIMIVVVVYAFGFYIANHQDPLDIVYPDTDTILGKNDFLVDFSTGQLKIGISDWDEVVQVLPQGKMLGMSTIYSPENLDILLTFTEDENILCKLHISDSSIMTNRAIKVSDPFSKVVEAYGPNYASVSKKGDKDNFDAAYGADNSTSIIFQIRNNLVSKIILQRDPAALNY